MGEIVSYVTSEDLAKAWQDWIMKFAEWKSFITLTFSQADRKYAVSQDQVIYFWGLLNRKLNEDLYGHHHTRTVRHGYFSYVVAIEPHRSGALHAHALVDQPVDWSGIKEFWFQIAGLAYIEPVDDREKLAGYVSKYVVKGGVVLPYRAGVFKEPPFKPMWWPAQ